MSVMLRWGVRLAIAVAVATAAGCAVSIDLSEHPPFEDSMGMVVLREQTPLYQLAERKWYGQLELGGEQPDTSKIVCELPPGTLLRVDRISRRSHPSSNTFWVLGELWIAEGDDPVPFQYRWGNWDVIWRAPWELPSVPRERWVGLEGKSYHSDEPTYRNARRE